MADNMPSDDFTSIDLIPIEEYQETTNHDRSKRFTCYRCGRVFSLKNGQMGVKQHIVQVHVVNGEFQIR